MIIVKDKFVIAYNKFPLMFIDEEGDVTNCVENAYFYSVEKYAEDEISEFDSPEEYQVLKVEVIYEI